jgi:hypothetical protein
MSPERTPNYIPRDDEPIGVGDVNSGIPKSTIESDEIEIKIGGDLFKELDELARKMKEIDLTRSKKGIIKQVVIRAIALLQKTEGKEIVIRDKAKNINETIYLWK